MVERVDYAGPVSVGIVLETSHGATGIGESRGTIQCIVGCFATPAQWIHARGRSSNHVVLDDRAIVKRVDLRTDVSIGVIFSPRRAPERVSYAGQQAVRVVNECRGLTERVGT